MLEFFGPQHNLMVDILRPVIFFILSLLAIWLINLWLCRNLTMTRSDTELNIHFSWLLLFTGYGIVVSGFAIYLSTLFKEEKIESTYAVPYLILGLLGLGLGFYLNRKIAHRLSQEEER